MLHQKLIKNSSPHNKIFFQGSQRVLHKSTRKE